MSNRAILYEKIYSHLKAEIESGHYQPGDLLPTEQELMATFEVSRMTTNRALQLLASEGLIVRKAGVGTFVSEASAQARTSRQPLEPVAAEAISTVNPSTFSSVGFVIPFLDHSFGPGLLAEVERELHKHDIALSVGCSYGSQVTEEETINRLVSAGIKGLILFPVNGEFYNPAILKLHVHDFPIVLVDKQLSGIPVPVVTSDNRGAAISLTNHLLQLGHTDIAFFSPDWAGTSTLADRRLGFEDALRTAGREEATMYHIPLISWTDCNDGFDRQQIEVITAFLQEHPTITAIFATDDELAEYCLESARRLGKVVPDQLSIVCFDGPAPKPAHWSFTSALQDQKQMAREAVRVIRSHLHKEAANEMPETITVPTNLHIGQSTAKATHMMLTR